MVVIWDNINVNIEDYKDYIEEMEEERGEKFTEYQKYEIVTDLLEDYLYEERSNLNKNICILALADVGLWNGRRKGYKLFDNLKDILYTECDYAKWYIDGMTLKSQMVHHDGTNYVNYYVFDEYKNGADEFLYDLTAGKKISKSRFYKYCKSAGKIVRKIYGL